MFSIISRNCCLNLHAFFITSYCKLFKLVLFWHHAVALDVCLVHVEPVAHGCHQPLLEPCHRGGLAQQVLQTQRAIKVKHLQWKPLNIITGKRYKWLDVITFNSPIYQRLQNKNNRLLLLLLVLFKVSH